LNIGCVNSIVGLSIDTVRFNAIEGCVKLKAISASFLCVSISGKVSKCVVLAIIAIGCWKDL
jgi:hypothetical protein